jgi:hypothetical protein
MKIDFTEEQYEALIKAVYLGNWMVNSADEEPSGAKFDAIEEYILSFAKDFGFEKYVDYEEGDKRFYPSQEMEDDPEIEESILRYDDNAFWEKLIYNLAHRDMTRKYGDRGMAAMSPEELFQKEQPYIEKYEKEFEENGLKNLVIKPAGKQKT